MDPSFNPLVNCRAVNTGNRQLLFLRGNFKYICSSWCCYVSKAVCTRGWSYLVVSDFAVLILTHILSYSENKNRIVELKNKTQSPAFWFYSPKELGLVSQALFTLCFWANGQGMCLHLIVSVSLFLFSNVAYTHTDTKPWKSRLRCYTCC